MRLITRVGHALPVLLCTTALAAQKPPSNPGLSVAIVKDGKVDLRPVSPDSTATH